MALHIATSDLIARVRPISVHSTTKRHDEPSLGYVAELIYKFDVVQYLKGTEDDEIVVRLNSGPKYNAYPDWFGHRPEKEAIELAGMWLKERQQDSDRMGAILLLRWSDSKQTYFFRSVHEIQGRGDRPVFGETWLVEDEDSMYQHIFTDEESASISLSHLEVRIDNVRRLMEGEHSDCVFGALNARSRVREQIRGTYRELTIGGYREPEPFPQYTVAVESDALKYAPITVLRSRRPPYKTPRFSHYWLDGSDRKLFETDISVDSTYTYEALRVGNDIPCYPKSETPLITGSRGVSIVGRCLLGWSVMPP